MIPQAHRELARRVFSLTALLLLIAGDAMAERIAVTPQELAKITSPGQTVHLVMKTGLPVSGKLVSIGGTELTLKVKASPDRTVVAKGRQVLPYSQIESISVVLLKGNKRTKLPVILAASIGTFSFVAAGATEELKSKYLPLAAGLTAGVAVGGYFVGKKLDQRIVTYVIKTN